MVACSLCCSVPREPWPLGVVVMLVVWVLEWMIVPLAVPLVRAV